ncbi:MAG: hypothetical protein FWF24_05210 [Alphaproteobacteria bacterium]|nr:hypothetical protein [Alphaproteobacteria bacterium]
MEEYLYAWSEHDRIFIPILQLSQLVGFKLEEKEKLQGYFLSEQRKFEIDFKKMTALAADGKSFSFTRKDVIEQDGHVYFTPEFYAQLLPIKITVNSIDLVLFVEAEEKLPPTIRLEKEKRQRKGTVDRQKDSFRDYEFDNRWFTKPVVDLRYAKGFGKTNIGRSNETTSNFDSYAVNVGMLAAALDTQLYVFGNTMINDAAPRMRLTMGRTFLEEPKNPLNLTQFAIGDIRGFGTTFFTQTGSGRGFYASSFKDLVMAADKTIDITGPLATGWEVELYDHGALIGFRQTSTTGRYEFLSVPVSFGQNTFSLVFYGPYGETYTEDRQYYAGTSPVKTGEFGYQTNLYQQDRYLIEDNEPLVSNTNIPVFNATGYYGITDNISAIFGYESTPDAENNRVNRQFATVGSQFVFSGASLQYNFLYDLESGKTGHNFEAQGDVRIGDLFARYVMYNDLRAPSSYRGEYLTSFFEGRFSSNLPWVNMPYYVSYQHGKLESGDSTDSVTARLSSTVWQNYHFTLENRYERLLWNETNDVSVLFQTQFGRLGTRGKIRYRTLPESELNNIGLRADYRWDRHTYFTATWDWDFVKNQRDVNRFSVSGARIFPFGGLTLQAAADTNRNISVVLGYNIGFGHTEKGLFADATNMLSERATISAFVEDEHGNPIPDVMVMVNGAHTKAVTDERGEAIITDIEPYQKSIVTIDKETVGDVVLQPVLDEQKLVLRPGVVTEVRIPFVHKGAIEGQLTQNIEKPRLMGYTVKAQNKDGDTILETHTDADGLFILDSLDFGTYDLKITRGMQEVKTVENIVLDDFVHSVNPSIEIPSKFAFRSYLNPEEGEDSEENIAIASAEEPQDELKSAAVATPYFNPEETDTPPKDETVLTAMEEPQDEPEVESNIVLTAENVAALKEVPIIDLRKKLKTTIIVPVTVEKEEGGTEELEVTLIIPLPTEAEINTARKSPSAQWHQDQSRRLSYRY